MNRRVLNHLVLVVQTAENGRQDFSVEFFLPSIGECFLHNFPVIKVDGSLFEILLHLNILNSQRDIPRSDRDGFLMHRNNIQVASSESFRWTVGERSFEHL